ncbi:MAG: PSD1 and planctomycete cytochrome C domain-containing protein [Acidobacteriia bacterium]|nr:PSD1 and planctomycete cytochrome C domain-containing protein [Terriglobia bacterium]
MPEIRHPLICGLLLLLRICAPSAAQTAKKVSFANDVAPILSRKCVQCHGAANQMANLDLRNREGALKGGQHGPAIVPGDAAASHLYNHVAGQQPPRMPLGGKLSDEEIAVLKAWIESGAEWDSSVALDARAAPANAQPTEKKFTDAQRKFWAFQRVLKPVVPSVKAQSWVRTPIDAFILSKLEERNLKPNPPAGKITLIRRAYFDLIGLPPTPEQVQAFLTDNSAQAFEKVVDELLASPHYGERWGRHWLDLARYADTQGFKADETRPNVWRYRDYVIAAFNEDKPYDRFIKEQIAGDELYPTDPAARVGTGFNRLWPDESNLANPILMRQEILDDITDTTASVFMGLTYGCAKCHDHKFDPILQKDYYKLQAFFAGITNSDRSSLLRRDEASRYQQQYAEWDAKTRDIRAEMQNVLQQARLDRTKEAIGMFPKEAQEAVFTPPEQRTPMQWQWYYRSASRLPTDAAIEKTLKGDAKDRYAALKKDLAQNDAMKPADPPVAEVMVDQGREAPPTHVLAKGVWDAPLDEVQPGFLTILDPNPAKIVPPEGLNSSGRRTALANWLADPNNPLTSRVMANRIWHYHFGQGISGSPSDFGVMGERPSNPQLLDYLAATFVENGWSIKKMHRMIMLSSAYQQSSAYQAEAAAADPDDKLVWRFERRRLEGEIIRDSMLFVGGELNMKMGGPGMYAPLPPGVSMPRSTYLNWKTEKDVAESNRRSVYIFVKRNLRYPMFEAFDFPDTHEPCPRRNATVTPAQPLALMNDELVMEWARVLATRVLNDSGLTNQQRIERVYRLALSRATKPEESQAILDFLNQQSSLLGERLAKNDKVPLPDHVAEGTSPALAAAFVDLCHTLLNSNEFIYMN